MAIVGVCISAVQQLGVQFAASHALPLMMPLLMNDNLTRKQALEFYST